MYARTLVALAFAVFAPVTAVAAEFAPGSEISLQGKVTDTQAQRSFWLQVGEDRVLVYTTNAQKDLLYVGQQVRVEGRVSDDFIRQANVEINARTIESISRFRAMSASAVQSP